MNNAKVIGDFTIVGASIFLEAQQLLGQQLVGRAYIFNAEQGSLDMETATEPEQAENPLADEDEDGFDGRTVFPEDPDIFSGDPEEDP